MVRSILRRSILWVLGTNSPVFQHLVETERRLSSLEDAHELHEDILNRLKSRVDEFTGVRDTTVHH